MLLILPLWTWLIASGLAGVAIVGLPVPADTGCVLRKNSGPHQAIGMLATLTDLFGEKLMTKSNEKMYYVSICRSIPLNDTTSLAGAVKYNSNGEYVVLGEIDQAEVVVNEEIIVLTYNGSEVNTNLNDECHGNRWKTQLTFICDPYAIKDTLKLVDEDPDQPEICQIKFEILTSKICRRNSSVVVRTPILQDKYNNLPLVISGLRINNNNSTNSNVVSNINENNLNNYRHDGFVYIRNNSKQQNSHQDDTNNYIREPYYKRKLMTKTEIPKLFEQMSKNFSRKIEETNDEMTTDFVKYIITFIPKPIFVVVMLLWSLYQYLVTLKNPKAEQTNEENTPLNRNVTYNQYFYILNNEGKFMPMPPPMMSSCPNEEIGTVNMERSFKAVSWKKISKRIWTVIGVVAVAVTLLILQIPLGGLILCLLWIWCVCKLCKPGQKNNERDENTHQGNYEEIPPPPPMAPTNVNYAQHSSAGAWIPDKTEDTAKENEFIGAVEVKGLHHQGDKDEESASQGANGSTVVHDEQNPLTSFGIIEEAEDTTDVSGESKISKESNVHMSNENELVVKKMDS
ncbi:uncharacterized protein LOC126838616 isoform X6 [Adelges cooleyi]|uniref:uncharacterized protein LOC126838616 isoform X6 n=1 Tax=Adelges cooleyi TaxID=133065 RepID=UPI00217F787D|nr:uncharacterized protein LOC126838616 isoform X6 [Adelges cooleyi]